MTTPRRRPGRPRLGAPRIDGSDTAGDILDAASELFATKGYSATTTRELASAARISQATMYHYFPNKAAILLKLLVDTVEPSVKLAREIEGEAPGRDPRASLRRLVHSDAVLLLTTPWNNAALYTLPEVQAPEFSGFHELRRALVGHYEKLGALVVADGGDAGPHGVSGPPTEPIDADAAAATAPAAIALHRQRLRLPFHIVESAVRLRAENAPTRDPHPLAAGLADIIADTALAALDTGRGALGSSG